MAYNRLDFFSRTKYTLPTSPFPINLILSKLPGPTSTLRTLIELELYVRRNATDWRIWPGEGIPLIASSGDRWPWSCETVSTMLSVDELGWCRTGCLPSSAVWGRPSDLLDENRPCALGAEATRRSFRASSSFPAAVAWSFAPLVPSTLVVGMLGVSGGEGGTLPAL
jgi:hypothetical protein